MLMEKSYWGKNELQNNSIYFYTVMNITHFSYQLCTLIYITSQKLRKETMLNINTHFTIGTTYFEFQMLTTMIPVT